MKRLFLILFLLLLVGIPFCQGNTDDKFINALRDCTPYSNSGNVPVNSMQVASSTNIMGWNNGKCKYRETISMNGVNADITCNFSKAQIKEITSVADAYFKTLPYTNESTDFSSIDSVKNNPISNVFNKYLQDSSVCSISAL